MSTAQGAEEEQPAQPVRLEGRRDADLSRWLWVVKWLLAIPHYVVLALLWLAVLVLTVVAFFAILFTGRYPRGIFDFNVGVLRWTWRVAFYSYGALGTDRYPPFTLDEVPDYPATLHVDYPERLSRGLVLVKWWLLAIPQYVLIGIMVGSGPWWASRSDDWEGWGFAGGLLGLLVLFAGVSLVFTGRYPEGIFDFVLGLDRWVARVAVYVGLMTDRYPPFRLDQGGAEPGLSPEPVAAPPPEAPLPPEAPSPPPPRGGRGGRIVLLVLGSVAAILAFGVLAGGCALVAVDQTQRDDDGFLMSPDEDFRSPTYAIVSEDANIDSGAAEWALDSFLGTVRIRSESDRPVFLGIAREADVAGYLDNVERDVVTDLESHGEPRYERAAGGAPAGPPGEETFWVASASGSGEQALDWEPEDGDWRVVLMNEDASRGVASELSIGAELDSVLWIGLVLLAVGALIATGAALAITAGIRRGRRPASTQAPTG
jgi:Domain of unknown function (DUF4389)